MKKLFLCLLALLLLPGCVHQPALQEADLFAMDTTISLQVYAAEDAQPLLKQMQQLLSALDSQLSVTRPGSPVAQLNAAGQGALPESACELLKQTMALSRETGGALDPAIYSIVSLWGFTAETQHVPTEAEITEAKAAAGLSHVALDGNTVTLSDGCQLDFGAVAKGYAGQLCAGLAKDAGVAAVLTLGGNVQTVGTKPDRSDWQIGLADPDDPASSLGVIQLSGSWAVVTSGDYQRYFEENGVRYHHIMDPATGYPAASGLRSVTIVAQDGLRADGLSTALFVMGLERATEFWRQTEAFDAIFIDTQNQIYYTQGLEGKFSCDGAVMIAR